MPEHTMKRDDWLVRMRRLAQIADQLGMDREDLRTLVREACEREIQLTADALAELGLVLTWEIRDGALTKTVDHP